MKTIKQSDPRATERRVYFTCVDAAALQTRLQSSDMSTWTIYISKNGGTPTAFETTPTQVDATNAKGLFYLQLAVGDCDTVGSLLFEITNTGGTKTMEPREIEVKIEQAFFGTITSATTTAFTCDRTEATANHWLFSLVSVLTGSGTGQIRQVSTSGGGLFGLSASTPFAVAPSNGDFVEFIAR